MNEILEFLAPITDGLKGARARLVWSLKEILWLHRNAGETLPLTLTILYVVMFLFLCFLPIGAARAGASASRVFQLVLLYVVVPGLVVAWVAYIKGTVDVWAWHGAGVTIWRGQRLRTWWPARDEYWVFLDARGQRRVPWVWVGERGKSEAPTIDHPAIALTLFAHDSGESSIGFAHMVNAWEQAKINSMSSGRGISRGQAVSIGAGAILAGVLWLIALG